MNRMFGSILALFGAMGSALYLEGHHPKKPVGKRINDKRPAPKVKSASIQKLLNGKGRK